jgi:chromosome segregation ATPase
LQRSDAGNLEAIEAEIETLENNLRNYEQRRANLLQALELGEFGHDEVLDRLNNLKRLRREDEAKLTDLEKTRNNINSLAEAKIKLGELYESVLENLKDATAEIKRLSLDALDIKVYASTERVEIQGVIPLALPTTEQTSGCLICYYYNHATGKESISILPKGLITNSRA